MSRRSLLTIAVLGLLELGALAIYVPPAVGWRCRLQEMAGPMLPKRDLLDPWTRLQSTGGAQSVDADGSIVDCIGRRRLEAVCRVAQ